MIASPYAVFTTTSHMNITFDNTASPKIRNSTPLDVTNLAEILSMTPQWAWTISTEYKAVKVYCMFAGERAGRKGYAYRHELNTDQMHLQSALLFIQESVPECTSFKLVGVQSRSVNGYVFTFL